MNSYDFPSSTTVLLTLAAWLSGLAAIAWMSVGALTSPLELVAPLLLTAGAIAAGFLLFAGGGQIEDITEELRARLTMKDAPAGRAR